MAGKLEVIESKIICRHGDTQYRFPRLNVTDEGRLVLFYRVGLTHMSDSGGIMMRTAGTDGGQWSEPSFVHVDPDGYSANNVVECMCRSGSIVLFISRYNFALRRRQTLFRTETSDLGASWSVPRPFEDEPGLHSYYMTDVIRTSDGLLGCSSTFVSPGVEPCFNILWHSADDGRTWQRRSALTEPDENLGDEVAMLEVEPGRILLILRDRRRVDTFVIWSTDGGRTWGPRAGVRSSLGTLQRPLLRRLADGTIFLSGRDYERKEVVAFLSRDGGESFGLRTVIEKYHKDGAYTGAVQIDDRTILMVYYSDRIEAERPDLVQALVRLPG